MVKAFRLLLAPALLFLMAAAPAAIEKISVFFPPGQSTLTEAAERLLDQVVSEVKSGGDVRITITGHAGKSSSPEASRKLAAARAESVRRGLIRRGIDTGDIVVHEAHTAAEASGNEPGIAERRVDIIIAPETATGL